MRKLPFLIALAALGLATAHLSADLPPPTKPINEVIDQYIDAGMAADKVKPAPQADDATLIRRLTLDLVGRIPTVLETKAFLADSQADKRAKLVDRLMASPAFVRHLADDFDTILLPPDRLGGLRDYLTRAFMDNRAWDRIFKELILADEEQPATKGTSSFLKVRVSDIDKLTSEVSSLFFGVNVSCAQCHDHPLVHDWKQDHFYGMKSFFSRTYEVNGFLAEREYGLIKFKTTKGEERKANMMFLTGKLAEVPMNDATPDEQKREKELIEKLKKEKKAPPAPKVSARAKLVEMALQLGQREFFTRAIVNRVWHRLFGYGIVMPLDQMHSENPPSHPELMAWLARDMADHGFEIRRLVRGIVLSKAYSRSSKVEGDMPRAPLFAVARIRAMTPMQFGTSLRIATSDPQAFPADAASKDFDNRIQGLEGAGRGLASMFEQPGDDFQVSVGEALLFSNSDRISGDLLSEGGDRLIGRLKQIKDRKEQVVLAVRTVLNREASPEEIKVFDEFLGQRAARPVDGLKQMVWALVTNAEFRFNY